MKGIKNLFLIVIILLGSISFAADEVDKIDESLLTHFRFLTEDEVMEANIGFENFLSNFSETLERALRGDVVGNGGGLLEGQAYFDYRSLPKFIANAFEQTVVEFSNFEREVLVAIIKNMASDEMEKKLIFLDDLDFFRDDNEIKAAKTGFSAHYPIYINRPFLYQQLLNDRSALITLLVHELGHQTGVKSHSFLDALGSKLQFLVKLNTEQRSLFVEGKHFEITIYNHAVVGASSDIEAVYQNRVYRIQKFDYEVLKKKCGLFKPVGYQVFNPYWRERVRRIGSSFRFTLGGWIMVKCTDDVGNFFNLDADFTIDFRIEKREIQYRSQVY